MGTRSGTRFHELALWSAPERVRGTFHWRMAVSSRFVDEWLRMSRASRTSGSRRLQLTSGERAHHGASPNSLSLTQKGQRTADLLQAVEARASVLFGFLFVLLFCLPSCRAPPPRRPCRRRCVVLPRRLVLVVFLGSRLPVSGGAQLASLGGIRSCSPSMRLGKWLLASLRAWLLTPRPRRSQGWR